MFCHYLKDALFKKFSLSVDVFVSRRKKHVHIAFKIPISEYESFDDLIDFLSNEWEKRKICFGSYKMVYHRLIDSMKWKFDYVFFEKKKEKVMENSVQERLRDKIVDVIHEILTIRYCFIKISQPKKGHTYLIVRKKRGRVIGGEKQAFHKKIFDVLSSVLNWHCERHKLLIEKYFFDPKVLKDCPGYHFHYFLVSCDKYVNQYF